MNKSVFFYKSSLANPICIIFTNIFLFLFFFKIDGQTFSFDTNYENGDYYFSTYAVYNDNNSANEVNTLSDAPLSIDADPCASIIPMTLGTTYTGTLGTTGSDWSIYSSCAYSEPGDEIVYSFTPATTGNYKFTCTETSGDPDFFLMSSCDTSGTNLTGFCFDNGSRNVMLTAGITYYLIVDNYSSSASAGYSVKVEGPLSSPANDECADAITLTVGTSCSYTEYTNENATHSAGVPEPGCANYLGGDVWFKVTVPASGHLIIDTDEGVITDGGMAIYSGSCGSLTLIECDDDDSPNGLMPKIDISGLTAGSTIYIRVWEYGNNNNGTFSICAYDPPVGPCASVTNMSECGITYQVTTGNGNGVWNDQICGVGTPGNEAILSYTPTDTGAYYLVVSATDGSNLTYAFREGSCQSTGWTCIQRVQYAGTYGPINLNGGTTYYFLIDDEDASSSVHQFYIKCPETPGTYYHPTQGTQGTYLGACMVNTCSGVYTDDGGTANYSNNINSIYRTFCPDSANKCVKATFNSFIVEYSSGCTYDYLLVLDGPTQGSPMIWGGCGNWSSDVPFDVVATNPSGCLTFRFHSDGSDNYEGWNITLSCEECTSTPTNNDCVSATAICGVTEMDDASPGPGITSTCGGCNLSENYSSWYHFKITNAGRLYFDIKPQDFFEDYDFALYKADSCTDIGNPVRCSYAMAPTYCGISSCTGGAQARYITNVSFNTINNTTENNCYRDYKSSNTTTVTIGSTYTLSVTVAGGVQTYIRAWFDWNKDLDFDDAGEEYIIASGVGAGTYTTNITIPATARLGQTGFRVISNRGSAPIACPTTSVGETEDYSIFISDGTHCSNKIKDADEIGVDCGGVDCVPCDAAYWATNTGMNSTATDFSEDVYGDSWVAGIPVNEGESYYLMINNWSPGAHGFDLIFDFQEGGAMDCDIVLPVGLLSFEAKLKGQIVTLLWETASEINNDYFTVMKSIDGNIFKPIGKIQGAGTSNTYHSYSLVDNEPITQTTYYRLKQTDFDGKSSFSEIIAVAPQIDDFSQSLNVFIHNVNDDIYISLHGTANTLYKYTIIDMLGKTIDAGEISTDDNGIKSLQINISGIANGIYNFTVSGDNEIVQKKFVIIK